VLALLDTVALEHLGGLARAVDDGVRLLARLLEPLAVLAEQLVGLAPCALGRVDRLVDGLLPALERLLDARERELAQQQVGDEERSERPDHQPHARRDEEVAAAFGGGDERPRHQDRKKAIRPKMNA
jgi:hypothetical protein